MTDTADLVLLESDRNDLEARLESVRGDQRRHSLFLLLGMSPAGIPVLFALSEFGTAALILLSLVIFMIEGWKALGARREAARIEIALLDLDDRMAELGAGRE